MNSDQLNERNKMIADLAVLAREMLNNVDCGDLKWCVYMNRLSAIIEKDSIYKERSKKLKDVSIALFNIAGIFLVIVSICIAFLLWIFSFGGLVQLICGEITIARLLVRVFGASMITSIIIYLSGGAE